MAQRWGGLLPVQQTQVRSLVREDPTRQAATKLHRSYCACALEPGPHDKPPQWAACTAPGSRSKEDPAQHPRPRQVDNVICKLIQPSLNSPFEPQSSIAGRLWAQKVLSREDNPQAQLTITELTFSCPLVHHSCLRTWKIIFAWIQCIRFNHAAGNDWTGSNLTSYSFNKNVLAPSGF